MAAGGHFGCPKITFDRISDHYKSGSGDTEESYRFIRHDAGKHRLYHTTCVCEYHCLSAFLERDLCFRDTDQLAFTIRYLQDDWSDELPTR